MALVDDLFRREAVRLVALLTARVGAQRIDLVEDAVQVALVAAMRSWPLQGVPQKPAAWLYTAARNALTDRLRRARFEVALDDEPEIPEEPAEPLSAREEPFADELLRLIVFCCHPVLTPPAQLALTLRLACGLGVEEIAAALFAAPEAIAQRIVRAKRELRAREVAFELPPARELREQRLAGMLNALYLLFDAGYLSASHEQWMRPRLCSDALRLVRLLAAYPATGEPETFALAALLHLSAARLPARSDAHGRPVPLALQDRSRWDRALIEAGFRWLDRAIAGETLTRYHIEAAIAAEHARAASLEATRWDVILGHYDQLRALFPSPVAELNRIIALRHARGPRAAFEALQAAESLAVLQDSLMYHATLGELHEALGNGARAAEAFAEAGRLAGSRGVEELFRARKEQARKSSPGQKA